MNNPKSKHTPFADGKFKGLFESIRNSPYPLHYTLRWPWFFKYPSLYRHSKIKSKPDVYGKAENGKIFDGVRLIFAGDIMVLNGDEPPVLCNELCELISGSDFFVANLEAPLGEQKSNPEKRNTFKFHMPKSFFDNIQKQIGLNYSRWVIGNANNHSGDAGVDGFNKSIEILNNLGVQHLGHRSYTDPFRIIRFKGFKLGFSAWTHWINRDMHSEQQPVISDCDMNEFSVSNYKKNCGLDFVVGLPHWEYEFQHFPRNKTRQLASRFMNNGFDILVGSHPHVMQPYEYFDSKLCFYSLGNFCGLGVAKPVKIIPLLEVHICRNSTTGSTYVKHFKYHYFYQLNNQMGVEIVPLKDISENLLRPAVERISKVIKIT